MWKDGDREVSFAEAKEVFRIDSYAKGDLREAKITRLQSLFTNDEELMPFLDHVIKVLNRETTS